MKFNNLLFRASGVGYLMTDPRAKADKEAGNLSESAKTNCIDVYVSAKYGRHNDVQTKYMTKGNQVEEDSITLYSRLHKKFYKKNEIHLNNEFVMGTPDVFTGESITNAETVIDIKSSWDLYTFHRTNSKDINPIYWWQLQTYMWLTGARKAYLAYCLVNTPVAMIEEEKRRLFYKMNVATTEDPTYLEACEELELSMTYDDIPLNERLIEYEIPRDDAAISRLSGKVIKAREFIQEYENKFCGIEFTPSLLKKIS